MDERDIDICIFEDSIVVALSLWSGGSGWLSAYTFLQAAIPVYIYMTPNTYHA